MHLILPGALLIVMLILVIINQRLKSNTKSRKITKARRTGSSLIKIINIFLFVTFILSFNVMINEIILDSLHIMIIEDDLSTFDRNFYSEDYGEQVSVIEYPVYGLSTTNFGRMFKVTNNKKFDSYLTSLDSFEEKYIQEDLIIYTIEFNQAKFYIVYLEFNNYYRLLSATTMFSYLDSGHIVYDYIPIIPCSYFNIYEIGMIDTNSITFQTEYTWDETKEFYQALGGDIVTIDETQKSVLIYNSVKESEYKLTYKNNSIALERLIVTD